MQTITKEYEVYDFDELDENIKQKLIEDWKEDETRFYCENLLYNDMLAEAENLIIEHFKNAKCDEVYYDLSHCQGSGTMIEFSINIVDLNNIYHFLADEETRFINDKGILNEIKVYHNDNFYYHEYTFDIKYNDDFGYYDYEDIKDDYNITEKDFNSIEDKIINFLDTYNKLNKENSPFIEDIILVNKELTKIGYDFIENAATDEKAIEFLKEQKYLKDGNVF